MSLQSLRLLMGNSHPCGYLAGHEARSAFVDPAVRLDPPLYGALLAQGFRRSGDFAYRPLCVGCRSCLPARIRVADFVADRSQQRCQRRNRDLRLQIRGAGLNDEHYALYRRYLGARHAGAGMDPDDAEAFHEFLGCSWGRCEIWEVREAKTDAPGTAQRLLAVAVVDRVPQGLSAVYTFFDPDEIGRGLGTWAILQQVEQARRDGLAYVYLGYWVPGSQKMDYKKRFRPLEILDSNGWGPIAAAGGFPDNGRLANHHGS